MRLLHVIQRYFPFQGGSERYFQAFSERFAADGATVQVLTTNAWDLEYFWDRTAQRVAESSTVHNGVRIQRLQVRHLPWPRLTHRAIRRIMAESTRVRFPGHDRLLRLPGQFGPWLPPVAQWRAQLEIAPDVVHSANIAFESMIVGAERLARAADVPHLVTPFLHLGEGPESKVRRYYTMPHQLALLRRADAVFALTSLEADHLLEQGAEPERVHVVGAGIDVASVTGGDGQRARERLGITGSMVLALGAAAYDKGSFHLAEAAEALQRAGRDREVAIVFAGPVLSEFTTFVEQLAPSVRRNLHVLGFVSEEEKRDLLAAADVLALPSRTESFGLVFFEAWANGKPVIGTWAGAIPAVVEHGRDGLLVPFGDSAALADAIQALTDDPELAARLGTAGQAKVVDEATWYERIRRVYLQVLGVPDVRETQLTRTGEGQWQHRT